jgi:hypothetical protein
MVFAHDAFPQVGDLSLFWSSSSSGCASYARAPLYEASPWRRHLCLGYCVHKPAKRHAPTATCSQTKGELLAADHVALQQSGSIAQTAAAQAGTSQPGVLLSVRQSPHLGRVPSQAPVL